MKYLSLKSKISLLMLMSGVIGKQSMHTCIYLCLAFMFFECDSVCSLVLKIYTSCNLLRSLCTDQWWITKKQSEIIMTRLRVYSENIVVVMGTNVMMILLSQGRSNQKYINCFVPAVPMYCFKCIFLVYFIWNLLLLYYVYLTMHANWFCC